MLELILTAAFLALNSPLQDPSADTKARFAEALKKLGVDEYQEREAASEEIERLPAEALVLVQAELKKDWEPEVRTRLERAETQLKAKSRRAAANRQQEAIHAWNLKTAIDAYEKVGSKDPRWDAKVRKALPLLVRSWEGDTSKDQSRTIYGLLSEAVDAGCDDPLALYGRARMYEFTVQRSGPDIVRLHLEAARAMKERGAGYHALRHCFVFTRAAQFLAGSAQDLSDDQKKQVKEWWDLALPALEKAAADPESPAGLLREVSGLLIKTDMKLTGDRKPGFDRVFEALTKAQPEGTLPLVVKGEVYTEYAWDARGSGWAKTVTPDGWKKMGERLAVAEAAFTEAWKRNPEDSEAPTLMITVELGQGKGRAVMETWFKRAMAADPNNLRACRNKMYYLEPKWYGNEQAMVGFGRELLAGGNWDARLPFQLVDAHWTLAGYGDNPEDYFKNPAVWKDIQSVYEPYLRKRPDSVWDRSFYAKLACYSGRWAEAKAQFDRLGSAVDGGAFKDPAELERFRSEAAEKGK
jgi:hypothetical protein